jgi:hypothetical protein
VGFGFGAGTGVGWFLCVRLKKTAAEDVPTLGNSLDTDAVTASCVASANKSWAPPSDAEKLMRVSRFSRRMGFRTLMKLPLSA